MPPKVDSPAPETPAAAGSAASHALPPLPDDRPPAWLGPFAAIDSCVTGQPGLPVEDEYGDGEPGAPAAAAEASADEGLPPMSPLLTQALADAEQAEAKQRDAAEMPGYAPGSSFWDCLSDETRARGTPVAALMADVEEHAESQEVA